MCAIMKLVKELKAKIKVLEKKEETNPNESIEDILQLVAEMCRGWYHQIALINVRPCFFPIDFLFVIAIKLKQM